MNAENTIAAKMTDLEIVTNACGAAVELANAKNYVLLQIAYLAAHKEGGNAKLIRKMAMVSFMLEEYEGACRGGIQQIRELGQSYAEELKWVKGDS